MSISKHIPFEMQAPYSLFGSGPEVWLAFHGYGQLATYFIRKFEGFDPTQKQIIAPQGLSKFYLKGFEGRVGANWMTKEDRLTDIDNQMSYVQAVMKDVRNDWDSQRPVVFGFSQGVATACRCTARLKLPFRKLILWAGMFPPELTSEDFAPLVGDEEIIYVTGNQDPFYRPGLEEEQRDLIKKALGIDIQVVRFEGKHEILPEVLVGL